MVEITDTGLGMSEERLASLSQPFALGDSTYEKYCEAGKRLDRRLEELGARRLAPRVDCDVDYEDAAAEWISRVVEQLAATTDVALEADRVDRLGRSSAPAERALAADRPPPPPLNYVADFGGNIYLIPSA